MSPDPDPAGAVATIVGTPAELIPPPFTMADVVVVGASVFVEDPMEIPAAGLPVAPLVSTVMGILVNELVSTLGAVTTVAGSDEEGSAEGVKVPMLEEYTSQAFLPPPALVRIGSLGQAKIDTYSSSSNIPHTSYCTSPHPP